MNHRPKTPAKWIPPSHHTAPAGVEDFAIGVELTVGPKTCRPQDLPRLTHAWSPELPTAGPHWAFKYCGNGRPLSPVLKSSEHIGGQPNKWKSPELPLRQHKEPNPTHGDAKLTSPPSPTSPTSSTSPKPARPIPSYPVLSHPIPSHSCPNDSWPCPSWHLTTPMPRVRLPSQSPITPGGYLRTVSYNDKNDGTQ